MKVFFEEGLAEVTVEGVPEPVMRGQHVEVSDEVGAQLLKQGWRDAGHHKKAAAKSTATPTTKESE